MADNPFSLRMDETVMAKLRILAQANSRSINKEIEFAVKEQIKAYERENGPIPLPDGPVR
ncbi:Arc family DNA-binding protein [Pseudoflavonifractor phocaeensis]|jgi:hypothetical protein|uniref:Arc family DNA-binding protein n=1 Tax=Pseudoflavonifractor phocaeensis TaxID=1870988 RepID=UPI0012BBBBBA|nr:MULTISPECIES: Arc family DNA-binding protein [Pseudoflavonifractor]KAB4603743.1 Arc family DNA-binding protein [Bacteroides thetaiotaomicron]MTQ98676.1 Arc family DNA-binding protein [Pseudoflavonifractor sp. BIOML-A16]MTR05520.1 Arc family DNA-binding protein [Pseudoflavonifractor sp. BIOML-A15]MTR32993.1 Arc family DNA-binding protein [Pseudoflavonifractor sp. BIOML-A14]MTR74950.1 Arc family DNA-binding protein [Pseudoflavonifractor sp. BIOML-A18]MTS64922.1 Arc family DNA-binding protein